MKTHKHSLAAIVCTFAASVSHAIPTVEATFSKSAFTSLGYDEVQITTPKGTTITTWAGRFQGVGTNPVEVSSSIFVDSLSSLFAYCYDIYQYTYWDQKNTYSISFNGVMERTLVFLGAVNSVLNEGKDKYDSFAWLHPENGFQAAAIQLGIWESKYEDKSPALWSLGEGSFGATGVADGEEETQYWWDRFTKSIEEDQSLSRDYVMLLNHSDRQDLITGDPPAVPEPGSLALLGLGLGGLFWVRRRNVSTVY